MKSFRLILLLVLIVAVVHLTAQEYCPPENCVPEEQCQKNIRNVSCDNGNKCCSIVKAQYRTHCNHFAGICMSSCNDRLWVKQAIDCPEDERCCILI